MTAQYKYEVEVNGQVFEIESDRELSTQEIGAAAQQYVGQPTSKSWGERALSVAGQVPLPGVAGIAGQLQAPVQGQIEGLIGKGVTKALDAGALSAAGTAAGGAVLGPAGGVAGSVAARKLNVALGLEEAGPIGDIASAVIPAGGYLLGPALKAAMKIPIDTLLKGGAAGGAVGYLTGSPELATLVGTMLGVGKPVANMIQRYGLKHAAKWLINSRGSAAIGAILGSVREAAQYYGVGLVEEPEPKAGK